MTPDAMARLHAQAFDRGPRPWSAAEFAALAADPGVLRLIAATGFALGRVAGPEAELLTIAVAPEARRRGTGAALLARFETAARAKGAQEAFLEVAETNEAARRLYAAAGWAEVGRRRGYVRQGPSHAVDALVLRKLLEARAAPAPRGARGQ